VERYNYSKDLSDLEQASAYLADSLRAYEKLAALTVTGYRFANSMQTSQRKIPFPGGMSGVGTNYHWVQLVPMYRKELEDFQARVAELKRVATNADTETATPIAALPAVKFKLVSTNSAETYEVKRGARPFTDRNYTIQDLAPELNGLTGVRFSQEAAKS